VGEKFYVARVKDVLELGEERLAVTELLRNVLALGGTADVRFLLMKPLSRQRLSAHTLARASSAAWLLSPPGFCQRSMRDRWRSAPSTLSAPESALRSSANTRIVDKMASSFQLAQLGIAMTIVDRAGRDQGPFFRGSTASSLVRIECARIFIEGIRIRR
jgi:hypothetical protein